MIQKIQTAEWHSAQGVYWHIISRLQSPALAVRQRLRQRFLPFAKNNTVSQFPYSGIEIESQGGVWPSQEDLRSFGFQEFTDFEYLIELRHG